MTATARPIARSLVLVLVAALSLGPVGAVHAQDNALEDLLAGVMTESLTGAHITCPPGRETSAISACFVLSADFDLARMQIERSIRQYNDASWPVPWSLSDDRSVQSRFLEVTGQPMFIIFMTPDYAARNSEYSTVVWVIQQERFP